MNVQEVVRLWGNSCASLCKKLCITVQEVVHHCARNCASLCKKLCITVQEIVHHCARNCASLCKKLCITVQEIVHHCARNCASLCKKLCITVQEIVHHCARNCASLCKKLRITLQEIAHHCARNCASLCKKLCITVQEIVYHCARNCVSLCKKLCIVSLFTGELYSTLLHALNLLNRRGKFQLFLWKLIEGNKLDCAAISCIVTAVSRLCYKEIYSIEILGYFYQLPTNPISLERMHEHPLCILYIYSYMYKKILYNTYNYIYVCLCERKTITSCIVVGIAQQ